MEPISATTLAALYGAGKLGEMAFDAFGAAEARKAAQRARDERIRGINEAEKIGLGAFDEQRKMLEPTAATYLSDLANWRGAMQERSPEYDFDTSGYTIDRYLDPQMAYEQQQAANQLNAQAAVTGGLYSGAQAKALQDRSQQIARQGYGDAFGRMQQERQFGYQAYADKFRAAREAAALKASNLAQMLNTSGAARQGQIQSAMDAAQLQMQGAQGRAGISSQDMIDQGNYSQNQWGRVGNALGTAAGTAASYGTGAFNPIPQVRADMGSPYAQQQQAQAMGQASDAARYNAYNAGML